MIVWLRLLTYLLPVVLLSGRCEAACRMSLLSSISPATINVGGYTATGVPLAQTVFITVNFEVSLTAGGGMCDAGIYLQRTSALGPAIMTQATGSGALPYDVRFDSGAAINFGTGAPSNFVSFSPFTLAGSGTKVLQKTVKLSILPQAPNGLPPTGAYTDQLKVHGYNTAGGTAVLDSIAGLKLTATVAQSCDLTASGSVSLDFTSDITAGLPLGAPKSTSFLINCNAAAKIRVTSSAMAPTPARLALAGFDNLIDFHAQASIPGASASLTTAGATAVSSTSLTKLSSSGSNIPVTVQVNLVPGLRLQSATYRSALQVIVDPLL